MLLKVEFLKLKNILFYDALIDFIDLRKLQSRELIKSLFSCGVHQAAQEQPANHNHLG